MYVYTRRKSTFQSRPSIFVAKNTRHANLKTDILIWTAYTFFIWRNRWHRLKVGIIPSAYFNQKPVKRRTAFDDEAAQDLRA